MPTSSYFVLILALVFFCLYTFGPLIYWAFEKFFLKRNTKND